MRYALLLLVGLTVAGCHRPPESLVGKWTGDLKISRGDASDMVAQRQYNERTLVLKGKEPTLALNANGTFYYNDGPLEGKWEEGVRTVHLKPNNGSPTLDLVKHGAGETLFLVEGYLETTFRQIPGQNQ